MFEAFPILHQYLQKLACCGAKCLLREINGNGGVFIGPMVTFLTLARFVSANEASVQCYILE